MKKLLLALLLFCTPANAQVKISQLPLGSAASTGSTDSIPYYSVAGSATDRLTFGDLINLPSFVATYAPLASPTFTGTVTIPALKLGSSSTTGYCWTATDTTGDGSWQACASSGGGTWGSITGTLSNQTDLQNALNLKAPLSGPTFTGVVTTPNIKVTSQLSGCAQLDASGNLTTTGSACGTGGGGITTLTGDVTATGSGSVAATLAATSNGTLTTLSGLTTASSLASVGTITSGTWHGTAVANQYGGTGLNTSASTGVPSISSGTWSVNATLPTSLGGLGGNFGSSTGALSVSSGTVSAGALGYASGGTNATTQAGAQANMSPQTTKGDITTYTTAPVRHAVPGDYGKLVADSAQTDGWRSETYTQIQHARPGKNYIQYADFENNATTGWTLGTIGTLTNGLPTGTPTFGSGASGNLSLASESSSPLGGTYSLGYVSSAATTVGNMVASSSYAIDAEDQAKVMSVRFSYSFPTGSSAVNKTATSSNSYAWAAWDVTNSVWLSSAGNFCINGSGSCIGTFQTGATTANIRFVFYNANATTGAATAYLDDVYVGPQVLATGPNLGDWNSNYAFTFSASCGTVTSNLLTSHRVGDSLEVWGTAVAGTTTNASSFYIALPSGLSIDYTKISSSSNGTVVGNFSDSYTASTSTLINTSNGQMYLFVDGSTTNEIFGAVSVNNSNLIKETTGNSWVSSTPATFYFKVPIVGWSSNAVQSSDYNTRVIAAAYYASASFTSSSTQSANFDTKLFDTNAAVSASPAGTGTWKFTAPVTGYYQVSTTLYDSSNIGAGTGLNVYKNGTANAALQLAGSSAGNLASLGGLAIVQLNSGDYIDIRPSTSDTYAGGTYGGTRVSSVSINILTGPATVSTTETVKARYIQTSGQTIGTSPTAVTFGVQSYDSHNAFSGSTFTAPVSGDYSVKTNMRAVLSGYSVYAWIYKNGSEYSSLYQGYDSTTSNYTWGGTDDVQLNQGDTIQIYAEVSTATALSTTAGDNYVSIVRVGN